MKKIMVLMFMAILMASPFVSADLIPPGQKYVPIENTIVNMDEYPDQVFFSGTLGNTYGNCGLKVIEENGQIPGYYKFCSVSVYAMPKEKFNAWFNSSKVDSEGVQLKEMEAMDYEDYLISQGAKKVVTNIETLAMVSESNPIQTIERQYVVDLDKTATEPYLSHKQRSSTILAISIVLPLLAFIALICILLRRKK